MDSTRGAGPRLQDTLYYTVGGSERWVPDVERASGLFGTANLADPNHISMAWLAGPQRWILLYGRPATNEQEGEVVARIGNTLWDWSDEIPIVSPERSWDLYGKVKPGE